VDADREIVTISWYQHRPDWYELVYADGTFERVPGGEKDADKVAQILGMVPESLPGGMQWERRP
jgi:hypothetical protein